MTTIEESVELRERISGYSARTTERVSEELKDLQIEEVFQLLRSAYVTATKGRVTKTVERHLTFTALGLAKEGTMVIPEVFESWRG